MSWKRRDSNQGKAALYTRSSTASTDAISSSWRLLSESRPRGGGEGVQARDGRVGGKGRGLRQERGRKSERKV